MVMQGTPNTTGTKVSASLGQFLVTTDPTLGLIKLTYDSQSPRFERMDEDEALLTGEPYVLREPSGPHFGDDGQRRGLGKILEDVVNVTMNDARVFVDRALSVFNEAEAVIVVKGQRNNGKRLTDHQAATIENFIRDAEINADEALWEVMHPGIGPYGWEQIGVRGGLGRRYLMKQRGDHFFAQIVPFDLRNAVYGVDRHGLNWVAFARVITKEESEMEYGANGKFAEPFGVEWDYWSRTEERTFVNNQLVGRQDNPLGYPPFVIDLVQSGTFLGTSWRAIRMNGDSLLGPNRDLYPHWNAINSIMQTMNYLTLAPPAIIKTEDGEKLPEKPIFRMGRYMAMKNDEGVDQMTLPDIQASNRFFQATLGGALHRETLAYTDWGNLAFQLSNVALATLGEAARQVYTPRLFTMERSRKKGAMMMIDQMKRFDLEARIGRSGEKRTYTASDLQGDYSVDYKYFTQIPEETAATYGLAEMQRPWISSATIREDTLHLRNPQLETDKWLAENAAQVSTALALFVRAKAMEDLGNKDQARLLLIESGQVLAAGLPQEIARLTGTEGVTAVERAPAAAAAAIPASPTTATRSTRRQEPPGGGEIEQEVPSV